MTSPHPPTCQGDLLWQPDTVRSSEANLTHYLRWLRETKGLPFDGGADYPALWQWSVDNLDTFWNSIREYFDVQFHSPATTTLGSSAMPSASWFPGARLNYAEHALRVSPEGAADTAILYESEPLADGTPARREEITRAELVARVTATAAALRASGIKRGDRVVGYLPNLPEAVVVFLAAASLGAIWSNCPAELSSRGVIERFSQIEPVAIFVVDAYRYGGKIHDRREAVCEIIAGLPSLRNVVLVPGQSVDGSAREHLRLGDQRADITVDYWEDFTAASNPSAELLFEPLPFDHPLWILFSSGTTGAPKAIVHGHGGVLFEQLKALSLHLDLRVGDRFFWYTTSGWMMWNMLVSGLLLPGVTVVLYDGSPKYPSFDALWAFLKRNQISYFGTSAPYLLACIKDGVSPIDRYKLDALRSIGSTGAPLPPEAFGWIHRQVKQDVLVGSVSGGTDVCTAFVLSNPLLPEYAGELQCVGLGSKIEAWNDNGEAVFGEVGELVMTAPFPSMPVSFWGDHGGSRLRASYFEKYPGIWAHGDWIEIGKPGCRCVIHGRSDSTLNRGGVRMGTAEFYSVVEDMPEVAEALVIDTGGHGREDRLWLFVVPSAGAALDTVLRAKINARLRAEVSPRHVPDAIFEVPEIPHTLNGKKLEVPVKRILTGVPLARAVSRESVANPGALDYFVALANGTLPTA